MNHTEMVEGLSFLHENLPLCFWQGLIQCFQGIECAHIVAAQQKNYYYYYYENLRVSKACSISTMPLDILGVCIYTPPTASNTRAAVSAH